VKTRSASRIGTFFRPIPLVYLVLWLRRNRTTEQDEQEEKSGTGLKDDPHPTLEK
jgi:hypothetical protein